MPFHAVDPPIGPPVVLQLVVLLGIEDVLGLAAQHLEGDEQLLVATGGAVPILLGLEDEERCADLRRVPDR